MMKNIHCKKYAKFYRNYNFTLNFLLIKCQTNERITSLKYKKKGDDFVRCGLFVRVSTDDQKDNGYSIDSQLRMIKEYCEKKNYDIIDDK